MPESPAGPSPPKAPDTSISAALPATETPKPENLALGKPVKVSNALPSNPPEMAVDGTISLEEGNWWGAGDFPPQWIEIDLQTIATIEAIRLYISQHPQGRTVHRVWGRGPAEPYHLLHEFSGETADGDVLVHALSTPREGIRFIKVETLESPSWVSWQEIEIIGFAVSAEPYTGPVPDITFHNGQVVTMEEERPLAQALAIQGEKILAVGSDEEILAMAGPETQIIDLQGRMLMPGFVDAHTHIFNDAEAHLGMSLEQAQQLALQNGITTLGDMFVPPEFLEQMQNFARAGKLRVRTSLYLSHNTNCGDTLGDWWKQYPPTREPGELLRIGGVKIFADGGTCGRPALSFELPGIQGLGDLWLTQEQLNTAVAEAQAAGYQVVIHAIGDRAIEQAQNAIAFALGGQPNTFHHRIDHNSVIRPDLMSRYSEIGIVAAIFAAYPVCNPFSPPLPPAYRDWEWPWRALLEANPGLHIAWHGDDPWVGPISPILELYSFVTRKEVAADGVTVCEPPEWLADDTITVEEALPMMTIESAYALFREEEVGSLRPGKFADLIILSDNPLIVNPENLKDLNVLMTMVGGHVEYCATGYEALCP